MASEKIYILHFFLVCGFISSSGSEQSQTTEVTPSSDQMTQSPGNLTSVDLQASTETNPAQNEPLSQFRNMTALMGGTVHLPCPVILHSGIIRATAYPRVSWIRRRDWHILTVGRKEYTSDQRFKVVHREGSLDWLLQIKYLQERDTGLYECQVTLGSKTSSHLVQLWVEEPRAIIEGGAERHIEEGSSLALTCLVNITPPYLFWYKEKDMVNYGYSERIKVGIDNLAGGVTQSNLEVRSAQVSDSGNYTCTPANSRPAHVTVFVTKGDKMQPRKSQGDTSGSLLLSGNNLHLLMLIMTSLLLSSWPLDLTCAPSAVAR